MAREKKTTQEHEQHNDVVVFKFQKTDNFGEKRETLEVMDQSLSSKALNCSFMLRTRMLRSSWKNK